MEESDLLYRASPHGLAYQDRLLAAEMIEESNDIARRTTIGEFSSERLGSAMTT